MRLLTLALFASSAALATTFTQPRQSPPNDAPTLQVYSRETIVDVTVTDAKGNPVHGLKQSDFTILEDGKPVDPNSFQEHRSDQGPPPAPAQRKLPPNTFSNVSSAPTPGSPLYILLLDELNTPVAAQMAVHQSMLDFFDKLEPGTQVAVFRLTGQLSLLQAFTSDRELLKAALNSKGNVAWHSPVDDHASDPDPVDRRPRKDADTLMQANHVAFKANTTIAAMRQLARYVSGMPGRKNLIWFTSSFPFRFPPVTDPAAFPGGGSEGSSYDFTDEVKSATDLMARSHLVVYPIEARGLQSHEKIFRCPANSTTCMTNRSNMVDGEQAAMTDIAAATGGKASFDNGFAEAAERAVDAGSNYYTLTYVPANHALDSRFRKITVKVDQPHLSLEYRNGYYAVAPTVDARGKKLQTVSPMEAAMTHGTLDATQILFIVQATGTSATEVSLPASNQPNPKLLKPPFRRYSVAFNIDIHNIQFTPAANGTYHADFEYSIFVYGPESNDILNFAGKQVHPDLTAAAYRSALMTGATAHDEIDVPAKGDYSLRIVVRDINSDRVGSVEVPTSSIGTSPASAIASGTPVPEKR